MSNYIKSAVAFVVLFVLFATNLFASQKATVKWKFVNLRATTAEDSLIVTKLSKGAVVAIINEKDTRYEVETSQGIKGWLVKESVTATPDNALKENSTDKKTALTEQVIEPVEIVAPIEVEEPSTGDDEKDELVTLKELEEKSANKAEPQIMADSAEPPSINDEANPQKSFLDEAVDNKAVMKSPSFFSAFLQMIFSLLIVLGIILILYYVIKKYFSKSLFSVDGGSAVTVLATKYIGQKTILYVIDVIEKIIVVSIAGTDVRVLTEITGADSVERMRKEISALKENEKPFKKLFFDKVKGGSEPKSKEENYNILDELNNKIKDKVDQLKKE